jgi:hypothetical protein
VQKVFGDSDTADCSVALLGIKTGEAALLARQQSSFEEIRSHVPFNVCVRLAL